MSGMTAVSKVGLTASEAIERARRAAQALRGTSARERLLRLGRLREEIVARQEELLDAIQAATGKSRVDAVVAEIFSVLDALHALERNATRWLRDRRVPTPLLLLGKRSEVWLEPLGVVLVIAPWNYPFYQAMVPIAWALAAGNAVVFKPSEHTPLEGVLERLFREAGMPEDWVRVVYGDGSLGAALVDARPDKVFFTGSTATGKRILEAASRHLIPVALELGGKDAMIVFADADLDRAAAGAAWGAFTNAGQACTSVERLFVERAVYAPFRERIVARARDVRMGSDRDGSSDIGALTTRFQVDKVRSQIEEALAKGAKLLTGEGWDRKSALVPPMVVENAPFDCSLWQEETFGPVVPIAAFDGEDEVVRRVNESPYGLAASVWSGDSKRARRVAGRLDVGNVSVNNVMLTEGNPLLPFGGAKHSGFGRYKGEIGILEFTRAKAVILDKARGAKMDPNWFPYTPKKYRLFLDLNRRLFGGRRASPSFLATALKLESEGERAGRKGRSS